MHRMSKGNKKHKMKKTPSLSSASQQQSNNTGVHIPSMDLEDEHFEMFNNLPGIVQIFNNAVEPNFSQPWTKELPVSSMGSGFIVDMKHRLILTNAHVVEFARTILLRKNGDHAQYQGDILAISHQIDVAVVTVPDDKFWAGANALNFGELCRMQQMVDVVGYPIGGNTISITRGVVSRIGI